LHFGAVFTLANAALPYFTKCTCFCVNFYVC